MFGFGGRSSRRATPRGEDLRLDLEVSFEDAVFGKNIEVEVLRLVVCEECGGSGARSDEDVTVCPTCQGRGSVVSGLGFIQVSSTCPRCRGAGRVVQARCSVCKGKRLVRKRQNMTVGIPAGVESGNYISFKGEGNQAPGGVPGDLHVVFEVKEHEFFTRHGSDILCEVPISFTQAALGATIEVPALRSKATITVPPGTQTGASFRVPGKGVPGRTSRSSGDMHVKVVVKTPNSLAPEQETLLREFARLSGENVAEPQGGRFRRFADKVSKMC